MKSFAKMAFIAVSFLMVLNSCGGGGGSSHSTQANKNLSGVFEASYIKGVKVCDDNGHCAITDENGKFTLKGVNPPVHLTFSIGGTTIASYTASKSDFKVTPKVLAEGDAKVASYIGAMLHEIAGCEMNATSCDVSGVENVEVQGANSDTLVEAIKEKLQNNEENITLSINETNQTDITAQDAFNYANNAPEMVSDVYSYKGAMSEGFFDVNVSVQDLVLSYKLQNGESGSSQLNSFYDDVLFKDNDNYYLIGKNIISSAVDLVDSVIPVFALNVPDIGVVDVSKIRNKRFIYADIDPQNKPMLSELKIIDINASSDSALEGNWTMYVYHDGTLDLNGTGRWEVNGTHIDAYAKIDATHEKVVAQAIIKSSGNVAAIIVKPTEDKSYGIGVEVKDININNLNNKKYYAITYEFDRENNFTSSCFSQITTKVEDNTLKAEIKNQSLHPNGYCEDINITLQKSNDGYLLSSDNVVVLGEPSEYFIGGKKKEDNGSMIVFGTSLPLK